MTEPLTPERAARECAEASVRVEHHDRAPGFNEFIVYAFNRQVSAYAPLDLAERICRDYRELLSAAALAVIERCLRHCPVPGGLSEALLAQIDEWAAEVIRRRAGNLHKSDVAMIDLRDHVEHLTRALHDCGQDGTAKVWAGGYEAGRLAGAKEQREADLRALGAKWASTTAREMFEAARDAPLVTNPEGAP